MRPKTLILFIVAIGCGLVASIGVSQYLENNKSGPALETMKVYVAATDIGIGDKLDEKNIKLEDWPKDRVPEGAITELKQLENMYPMSRLYKGEPILSAKLSDSIAGDPAKKIPPGYRSVPVKVDNVSGGGGLLRPGNRVDVVVFLRKSNEVPQTETRTILRDVNVFAVEGVIERSVDKAGQAREARNVSLLVTPKQAEALMLAKELGTLSLTLRRPDEGNEESTDGETVQSLLGTDGENANEHKEKKSDGNGLEKWLSQTIAQAPPPPPTPVIAVPAPVVEEPPKFVMRIRTPNGDREYRWKDLGGEPEEFDPRGAAKNNPPAIAPAMPGPAPAPVVTPSPSEPAPSALDPAPLMEQPTDEPPAAPTLEQPTVEPPTLDPPVPDKPAAETSDSSDESPKDSNANEN